MASANRKTIRETESSKTADVVVIGLVVSSAVLVDPFGFQAFLLLRYVGALFALFVGAVVVWRRGGSLPRSRVMCVAIPIFLGFALLASLSARAWVVAVLGASGRQLGFVAWVLFAIAFVVGLSLFSESEGRRVESALVVGFASAIVGIGIISVFELVGAPGVAVDQQFGSRLQASFGNPAVLGAFVVMGLPIVVAGLVARRFVVLSAVASVVGSVLLILAGTRGAWVGAAIGAAFVLSAIAVRRGGATPWRVAVVGVVVIVLLGFTMATGRWGTALSGFEGRAATWQVAGQVALQNPVVGVGPEGFATAFAETVGEDYVIRYTRDGEVDRAHNGVLDVVTTVGIPATVVYLVLVAAVLMLAWKATWNAKESRPVIFGVVAGIVAYLVQQQVFFQLAVVDLVFWFVVGLVATTSGMATSRRRHPVAAMAMVVAVAISGIYGMVGVYADHQDRSAISAESPETAMSYLERAAALRPSDDVHALIAERVSGTSDDGKVNARGGFLVDSALRVDSTNGKLIMARSALLVDAYELSGAVGALDAAAEDLQELVARDMTNGEAFLRLGAIAFYRADYDEARTYWERSAYLMPHREEPIDNLKVLDEIGQ